LCDILETVGFKIDKKILPESSLNLKGMEGLNKRNLIDDARRKARRQVVKEKKKARKQILIRSRAA